MKQNTKINIKKTKLRKKSKKTRKLNKKNKNTKNKNTRRKIGGGKKRPRGNVYEFDRQYDDFLNSLNIEDNQINQCRSTRGRNITLETVSLGSTNKNSFISPIKLVNETELYNFVYQDIKYGPQIVSLPVPPFRHAFLVNILPNKIMVSDWNGDDLIGRKKEEDVDFTQYTNFMELLEEKYQGKPIKFYKVNDDIVKIANEKNSEFGGGGCSEYIYRWVEEILKINPNFFSR